MGVQGTFKSNLGETTTESESREGKLDLIPDLGGTSLSYDLSSYMYLVLIVHCKGVLAICIAGGFITKVMKFIMVPLAFFC